MEAELALIHQKLDYLTEQVEAQRRSQQAFDEFKRDFVPVLNDALRLSFDEMADLSNDVTLEEFLLLLKRLLRDTRLFLRLMDQLEASAALLDEMQGLMKPVFDSAVASLDTAERAGYFKFARGGQYVMERVVSEFNEDDVRALGDNIVTILTTVRNLTQPDIMRLANNVVGSIREDDVHAEPVSTWQLLRELGDPKVRKGLARLLHMVKTVGDGSETPSYS